MKDENGFTLIELLAVILVLGIIALIAIPTVNRLISESKRDSLKQTTLSVSKAVEEKCTMEMMDGKPITNHYQIVDGAIDHEIPVKNLPQNGEIVVSDSCEVQAAISDGTTCVRQIGEAVSVKKNYGTCLIENFVEDTEETCFVFDSDTKTITGYNYENEGCPLKIKIPATIDGVPVEYIGENAFSKVESYDLEFINGYTFKNLDSSLGDTYSNYLTYSDYYLAGTYDVSNLSVTRKSYYKVLKDDKITKRCYNPTTYTYDYKPYTYLRTDGDGYSSCTLYTYYDNGSGTYLKSAEEVYPSGIVEMLDLSEATNLKEIGAYAFYDNNITSLILGDNKKLVKIGDYAFGKNLISNYVNLENTGVKIIGDGAFINNLISNVSFPSSLTDVYMFAFTNNNITDVNYPVNVRYYLDSFTGNPINNLIFSDNTNYILSGGWAHSGIINNLVLSKNTEVVTQGSFSSTNVKSVYLPPSLRQLGYGAFQSCYSLESVEVNGNVDIGQSTFASTNKLTKIKLGEGVRTIGLYAFEYSGRNGKIDELIIPNSVTTIKERAFQQVPIDKIVIGDNVTFIGDSAFENSHSSSIKLGNKLEYIGAQAFYDYNATLLMGDIRLPSTLKYVGSMAFAGLAFKSLYIPSNVETFFYTAL